MSAKPMDAKALANTLRHFKVGTFLSNAWPALRVVVYELMKTQTHVKQLERQMDKLINKVKGDVKAGAKTKAMKDIKVLLKADKKQDAKVEQCAKKPMKKGRK